MIWFTSDTHFGHAAVIRHSGRPFTDLDHMDAALVDAWNTMVGPRDEVWHLGDFAFRNAPEYLSRLNGRIHVCFGNHDKQNELSRLVASGSLAWAGDVRYLRHNGLRFFLSHYAHRVWPSSHHGSFHLFGHSHGSLAGWGRSMDVGVDAHEYEPISLDEVVARLEARDIIVHHEGMDGVLA